MVAPHAAPPYQQQAGNGLAVAGLVLGILGLALCWLPFIGWLCAIVGIILGAVGMSRAKKIGGKGKGMAVAGLICGILGLAIGVLLFVLATMAVNSFDSYMKKGKASEAKLQLRSIETKVKTFYIEKSRVPAAGPELPGPSGGACGNPGQLFPKKRQSEWTGGWQEMGFHIDEDSRCSYVWTPDQSGGGVAEAHCDVDCDGVLETSTLTITRVEGNLRADYTEALQ